MGQILNLMVACPRSILGLKGAVMENRVVTRVMDRYDYSYRQCQEMPLDLLIFLHGCARMEEETKEKELVLSDEEEIR